MLHTVCKYKKIWIDVCQRYNKISMFYYILASILFGIISSIIPKES